MASPSRLALPWLCALALLPALAVGQPTPETCRLEVQIEEHPDAERLAATLRDEARRSGACARPWLLRISPGPRGRYMLALWNGSDLETRWAENAREVEPVASLLFRLAVERAGPQASASASASLAPSAPSASPPASASAPAPLTSAPPSAGVRPVSGLVLGPTLGVGAKFNSGPAGELGALFAYENPWRFGVWPRVGVASGQNAQRLDVTLPLIVAAPLLSGPTMTLLLGLELGLEASWASGRVASDNVTSRGFGAAVGAGPELWLGARPGWRLGFALPVRYSTADGTGGLLLSQATTVKPRGNSGKTKTTTTTTTTMSPSVADRMGGWSVMLAIGLLHDL